MLRKPKVKKTIYIHVGAAKTGSTAIQEFLYLNEDQLRKEGLHISDIARLPVDGFILHHKLSGWGEKNKPNLETVLKLWEQVSNSSHGEKTLITSELFQNIHLYNGKGIDLFPNIKSILEKKFNIKIIFYIRSEELWIQSVYEQWIKTGSKRDGETIHELIKKPRLSQAQQVIKLSKIFGVNNIIVKPYEKSQFSGGNLFKDFLEIFNIDFTDKYIIPKKNPNPRLAYDALEFKRISNSVCPDKKTAGILNDVLIEYSKFVDSQSADVYRTKGLLSAEEKKQIKDKNDNLYQQIARDILGKKDKKLFIEKDDLDTVTEEFDINKLTKISSYIFIDLIKKVEILETKIKNMELTIENDKQKD